MKTIKNLTADELRKSILQLAIQGKLVKQDPNDEPASELVKRIYEEKNKLIAEGKIKKDKSQSYIFKGDDNCYYEKIGNIEPVKLEDLPFDIPDNWMWIRIKNIANVFNGNSINEAEKNKKYRNIQGRDYISTKDVNFNRTINYNNGVNIPYNSNFKIAPKGKILMCIEGGSAGRKIAITIKDVNFGNKLACFDTVIINDYYLFSVFLSNEFLTIFKSSLSGIIGGVSINTLKEFLIPLPPLDEQQRIVDKINSFEPLLEKYDKVEKELSKLEKEFPEKLKKSVLQYAIEGKLVKQDPNDEPASVLLERIKQEKERLIKEGKIKRDKNESYIYQGDDKNYYENIPEYWCKVPLRGICTKIIDGNHNPPAGECYHTEFLMLSSQNIGDGILQNLNSVRYLTSEKFKIENKRTNLQINDILFTSVGSIGRSLVYEANLNLCFQRSVSVITTLINPKFLKCYLDAPKTQYYIIEKSSGTAQKGFYLNQLSNLVISFPPLNEQIIIVKKVSKLLSLI